jgi:hypothetical protein
MTSQVGYAMDVQIIGLEEQLKKMGNFGVLLNRHLERGMEAATTFTVSKITPNVPVGVSSRLKNSIGSEIRTEGIGSVVGRVGSSLEGEEYPAVMEFGRKPGAKMPPPEALVRWVHVKGLAGTYSIKTRRRQGGKKRQANEDLQVAWMIARAISRKGIKGKFYMRTGLQKAKPSVPKFFKKEMDLMMEELSVNGS